MERSDKLSIKDWAEDDRPREKMLAKGPEALSIAELLAILIGSGTPEKSAVELMRDVMRSCGGSLKTLGDFPISHLCSFKGIGTAKAVTIMAAIELGRRRLKEFETENVDRIVSSCDVYRIMRPAMMELNHEEFWCLLLNNANRVLEKVLISRGGMTETTVDVRLIMRSALLGHACALVLCHNHPSGNTSPSIADEKITARIREAASIMGIRVLDHVIVAYNNYYSFADEGKL